MLHKHQRACKMQTQQNSKSWRCFYCFKLQTLVDHLRSFKILSKASPPLMIQDFKLTSVNKASICWELDIFVYRLKISSVCQLRPLSNTDLIEPTTRTCSELLDTLSLSHPAHFVWPVLFIAEQNSQKVQTYLKLEEVKFRQRWFEKEKMDPMKS